MKFGVLVFPGSNCDHDTHHVVDAIAKQPVTYLWHASEDLQGCDAILVPGGFAYGDYLRTGAIAKFAPVMQSVMRFAKAGGLVMGICNGFQILCEAELLPGALMRNASQHYICKQTYLKAETVDSPFTHGLRKGQVLQMPIGHMEGNYFCDAETLARLKSEDRIAFRYATPEGEVTAAANPNGSLENIAGVLSEGRNVLGLMPHPDRSSELLLGSADGLLLFQSMAESLAGAAR
jgi:phosphoribosylformylglycinamidine synthase subunit PurQ / glutaminase